MTNPDREERGTRDDGYAEFVAVAVVATFPLFSLEAGRILSA